MAEKVKRGFRDYLRVLILMFIAAILITIVVIMFKPFENVLGFTYFTYNETITTTELTELNSAGKPIDIKFSAKKEIRIDSDYATVRIEKDTSIEEVSLRITNKTKGFARAADHDTSFTYKITSIDEDGNTDEVGDKILKISVDEPDGFVFFEKNVEIAILIPYYDSPQTDHQALTITTNSGFVRLGNQYPITEVHPDKSEDTNIDFKDITVFTTSGNVVAYPQIENQLDKFSVRTESGDITIYPDLTLSTDFNIRTKSGEVKAKKLNASSISNINIANGKFSANEINSNVRLFTKSGEFKITKLVGDLINDNSAETYNRARITIGEIQGSVSLPFLSKSYIKFGSVTGQIYLNGTGSSINVDEVNGGAWIKTTSGNVNVTMKEVGALEIETTSGKIKARYLATSMSKDLSFKSKKGEINLSVLNTLPFDMNALSTDEKERTTNVFVESFDNYQNPLRVNDGQDIEYKKINFVSNGTINVSFEVEEKEDGE